MTYADPEVLSIEEAEQRGVGPLFEGVAAGVTVRVVSNAQSFVVIREQELQDLHELADVEESIGQLFDTLVANTRRMVDTGERTSLAEAIELFGFTPEELDAIDE